MDPNEMSLQKKLDYCQTRRAEAEMVVLYLARLSAETAQKVQSREASSLHVQALELQLQRAQGEIFFLKTKLECVISMLAQVQQTQPAASTPESYSVPPRAHDAGQSTKAQDCPDLIDLSDTGMPLSDCRSSSEQTFVDGCEDTDDQSVSPPSSIQESGLPLTQHIFRFQNIPAKDKATSRVQNTNTADAIIEVTDTSLNLSPNPVEHRLLSVQGCSTVTSPSHNISASPFSEEELQRPCPSLHSQSTEISDSHEKPSISADASSNFPKWVTEPDVFNDEWEKKRSILTHQRFASPATDLNFPDFFRHGIRFLPSANDSDHFRTVLISHLPLGTTLAEILDQVQGGLVVDAKLLETFKITKHDVSVLIVFAHESAAKALVKHASDSPFTFKKDKVAKTTLINTPTWPINLRLRKAISEHQHTRCIEICHLPPHITDQRLLNELDVVAGRMLESMLVRYERTSQDSISLDFSSVRFAGYVYGRLSTYKDYKTCLFRFMPDPCARPWDLVRGGDARRTMHEDGANS